MKNAQQELLLVKEEQLRPYIVKNTYLKAKNTYVCVSKRTCNNINCTKVAHYGRRDTKIVECCSEHIPEEIKDEYIRLDGVCKHEKCDKIAHYSEKGTRKVKYCKDHIPVGKEDNYYLVNGNNCRHKKCSKQASFGKIGSKTKEFCKEHIPEGKEDEYERIGGMCIVEGCKIRASFGYSGFSPECCTEHKSKRMVSDPKNKPKEKDILCTFCLTSVNYNEEYCSGCKRYMELGTTVKRHMKELRIRDLLDKEEIKYIHDKKVSSDSLRRPDYLLYTKWKDTNIVLEVDEDKHRKNTYTCECEISRMKEIYYACKKPKLLFIRYNPDKYISYGVRIFGQEDKEKYLINYVKNRLFNEPIKNNGLYVIYLFYDGFLPDEPEIEEIYVL